MRIVLASMFALASVTAHAQSLPIFGGSKRIGRISTTATSVSTSVQAAVSTAPISSLVSWQLCHQSDSSAPAIGVSEQADPYAVGAHLAPGACYSCQNCGPVTLKKLNVKTSTGTATYSVTQYGE